MVCMYLWRMFSVEGFFCEFSSQFIIFNSCLRFPCCVVVSRHPTSFAPLHTSDRSFHATSVSFHAHGMFSPLKLKKILKHCRQKEVIISSFGKRNDLILMGYNNWLEDCHNFLGTHSNI